VKKCNKCNKNKDLGEFFIRLDSPDGYRNNCKKCAAAYLKVYRKSLSIKEILPEEQKRCFTCKIIKEKSEFGLCKKNKDRLKGKCKNCKRIESKRYNNSHKDYYKNYKKENKEEIAACGKKYRKENKKILTERHKKYAEKNKEFIKKYKHEWYEKNKEKVYENKTRRRARKVGCNENYGRRERKITMIAFKYKCFNCGSKEKLHIDHHKPLIEGNALRLDNAVVLCGICNSSKGTKSPEEFYGKDICKILDEKLSSILEENKKEQGDRT